MIHLTPAASQELQRLRQHSSTPFSQVRLGLTPGCCSDWSYVFTPDPATKQDDDIVISCGSLTVVVSQANSSLLKGMTIDYSEDLLGGAFRYENPNAVYTSDCGNSFATTMPEIHESD